jgi:beta-glucosidase
VLLKSKDSVLPIKNTVTHIRVAGSSADNVGQQSGAWTIEWQGVDGNWLPESTSILSGIRSQAGPHVRVEYEKDGNFLPSSEKADIGIAVVGEAPYAEGLGDNAKPTLSPEDLLTIERLKATSDTIIVILVTGRPLIITDEIETWDGAIVAWLPGTEGVGVADVLFGNLPFKGKLPLPWPKSVDQLPITPDGKTKDGTPPLFPRYFGL